MQTAGHISDAFKVWSSSVSVWCKVSIYCEIIVIKLFKLTTMIFTFSFVFTWIIVLSNTAEGVVKKTVEFTLVVHIWCYKRNDETKKKTKCSTNERVHFHRICLEFVDLNIFPFFNLIFVHSICSFVEFNSKTV